MILLTPLLLFILLRLSKITIAHICELFINNLLVYKWLWIILPNWRYYLGICYSDSNKKYGRYSNHYWKPNRKELWSINGYIFYS